MLIPSLCLRFSTTLKQLWPTWGENYMYMYMYSTSTACMYMLHMSGFLCGMFAEGRRGKCKILVINNTVHVHIFF